MRRPSAATSLAALALFVALGGPAEAGQLVRGSSIREGTITTRQVRDRSLSVTDLTLATSRLLQRTSAGSVGGAEVRDGSIGALDLGTGSVFADELATSAVGGEDVVTDGIGARALTEGSVRASELADGEVGRAEIPDGVLGAADVGRFAGRLPELDFGTLARGACATRTASALPALRAGEDLRDDALVVTPGVGFPGQGLTLTAQPAGVDSLAVTVCNVDGPASLVLGPQALRYVSFDTSG